MPEPSASGQTWLVVGASRGIGHELVRQLLTQGDRVYATLRQDANAADLWPGVDNINARCLLFECDMLDDSSITV